MDDSGVSQNIGSILMIFLVVALAAVIFVYVMDVGSGSSMGGSGGGYTPQYAMMKATVVPGLSAGTDTWNANAIKIRFTFGNELDLQYKEGVYAGTEGIKFMLIDPKGKSHEAMQSITMKGQKINPGDEFYYFTVSPDINGQYYITNAYSRIGDKSKWGDGWAYLKRFAAGKWRVQIIDDNLGMIIADKEVML
ncbi:MAG: archaellin/type IV pilin N-terminal domain-containing protein [Methanogenium sp.]|jgi:FlaG/FlaF family flagellin (archaellin)